MVLIKLIYLSDEYVEYTYYPEKDMKAEGIVRFYRKTKERKFVKESKEDFGKRYAAHALGRIEEYQEKGSFLEEDIVAWY